MKALAIVWCALLPIVASAALQTELVPNVFYLRPNSGPGEREQLAAVWRGADFTLLDLRYFAGGDTIGTILAIEEPAGATRLVLIDGTTDAEIVAVLAAGLPRVVTMGPDSPAISPDIVVKVSPEADRQAFDAASAESALRLLIGAAPKKTRYDEAAMVRDYLHGESAKEAPGEPSSPSSESSAPATVTPSTATPSPTDLVLQRAVQIAEGLRALGR